MSAYGEFGGHQHIDYGDTGDTGCEGLVPNPGPVDDIIKGQVGDALWIPPPRSMKTGHRVAIGPYRPISTRHLNWRWKLAEYPMRWLTKWVAKHDSTEDIQGEEYIGDQTESGWPEAGSFALPRE